MQRLLLSLQQLQCNRNRKKAPKSLPLMTVLLLVVSAALLSIILFYFVFVSPNSSSSNASLTLYARLSSCRPHQNKEPAQQEAAAADVVAATASTDNSNRTIIWIQARWRTGSSLLAEALAQHPKALFLFEPEHIIESLKIDGFFADDEYSEWLEDFMTDLIQCKINKRWFVWFMSTYPPTQWPHDFLPLHDELLALVFNEKYFPTVWQRIKAFELYCRARPIFVVKTVRLDLNSTVRVLRRLPKTIRRNVKLITLWRDPRAVSNSVSKIERDIVRPPTLNFTVWLDRLCSGLADEYEYSTSDEFKTFLSSHDVGYQQWFYETLMLDARTNFDQLRRFCGIPLTDQFTTFITTHMYGSKALLAIRPGSAAAAASRIAGPTLVHDNNAAYSFSTMRSGLFDPYHWKKDISRALLETLNATESCQIATQRFLKLYAPHQSKQHQ